MGTELTDRAPLARRRPWSRSRLAIAAAGAAALAMAGCAAGPNFKPPAPPAVSAYTPEPLAATTSAPGVGAGESQRFEPGAEISADWWTLFHSPQINQLVDAALKNNPDLKAAQAALAAAHETALAQRGAFFPSVSAGFAASRQRQSPALAPTPSNNAALFSLFTPQVTVSYTPDVFGLTRRTVEQAQAQAEAARFQMLATRLTLSSNVAAAAIQDAALESEIDATRQLVDAETKMVEIARYRQTKGYSSGLDLAAQEAQLAQAQATLPPLLKARDQQAHLIAVLTGSFPSQAPAPPLDLAKLSLPADLPLSLPSRLVEQRPDVRQAEANLHAASAQIGIAAANRLPNLQLTAAVGNTALSFAQSFGPNSAFWTVGAALTAPIFEGGTLLHQERAAKAAYTQAAEQYRSTVLTAFQNVADTLTAIQQDAEGLKAAAAADEAARVSLELTQRQYRDGYAAYLALLTAQQTSQQARISLAQAQAARFADTAALFQALGGGWWRDAELSRRADAH
jgi:NodT family efflux transporter outer membrane factor (OMF) lipoprotein